MQCSFDEALGGASAVAAGSPPLGAYGLAPHAAGYRLADLSCAPAPGAPRADGVYSEFAVGLVLAGAFDYADGAGAGIAVPGSLVFGNKEDGFSCRHLSTEGNRRLVLFLTADLLEAVAEDLRLDRARFSAATAPPSRLTHAVSGAMLRIAHRRDDSEEAAAAVAEVALGGSGENAGREKVSVREERRVLEAVRYINANFSDPCTLDTLAAVAGMSRFRFARRFRAVTGEAPNRYLLNRRLSAAAAALAATRASIAEIAYDAGFNDLSYFYARFRSAFGCAPGAWRGAFSPQRAGRRL